MLDATITWTAHLFDHAAALAKDIPNPGQGEAPPFADKIEKLLGWAAWGGLLACVAGFVIIGARMGIQHRKGEGGSHLGSMFIVGFGCLLIVSAGLIVRNLAS